MDNLMIEHYSKVIKLFRVDEAHEIEGLDWIKHKEPAYPIGNLIDWQIDRLIDW